MQPASGCEMENPENNVLEPRSSRSRSINPASVSFVSNWISRIALALVVATTLSSALLGIRTYRSFLLLRSAYAAGSPMTSSIRPWMTLDYVSGTYHVSGAALIERLGLRPKTDPNTTLKALAEEEGQSLIEYVQRVQRVVAALAPDALGQGTSKESSWLGAIGDACLAAVLTYGYPALGLTILVGSIGLPLPDGLATTVAGSLVAQDRMDWAWAGMTTVLAAVLGDLAGYGLGRALDREILERHGRWFGYTLSRSRRVKLLFKRWGWWTVLITRTFASYLSPVVNLLAGAGRYRLSEFLALTVLGRLVWTSAYLGLGYAIGTDLEAAAGFLANLSGLLVSLLVLAGSGLVASGRVL